MSSAHPQVRFDCNFKKNLKRFEAALCVLTLALTGCKTLPTNAPTVGQINTAAKTAAESQVPYTLVQIDADIVRNQAMPQDPGIIALGALAGDNFQPRADLIRKGDTLAINFFEIGVSLFGGTSSSAMVDSSRAPTAGLQTVTVQVHEDGTVDLPYVGTVAAAGHYPEDLSALVRQRMKPLSEKPDVLVNITNSLESVVYVGGAVSKPSRLRLTAAHERLLDALTLAGGSPLDVNDLSVTLVRGTHSITAPLNQLGDGDAANIPLLPGDRVSLERMKPSYTVFGATDDVSQIPFDARQVSMAEALARATGPADARANPRGIYIFRLEARADGKPKAVVYQLNMLRPEAYFLSQAFYMRDKDVILFANSSTNAVQKALGLISQLFSPAIAVRTATQ